MKINILVKYVLLIFLVINIIMIKNIYSIETSSDENNYCDVKYSYNTLI